jgi:hypothetical protein
MRFPFVFLQAEPGFIGLMDFHDACLTATTTIKKSFNKVNHGSDKQSV